MIASDRYRHDVYDGTLIQQSNGTKPIYDYPAIRGETQYTNYGNCDVAIIFRTGEKIVIHPNVGNKNNPHILITTNIFKGNNVKYYTGDYNNVPEEKINETQSYLKTLGGEVTHFDDRSTVRSIGYQFPLTEIYRRGGTIYSPSLDVVITTEVNANIFHPFSPAGMDALTAAEQFNSPLSTDLLGVGFNLRIIVNSKRHLGESRFVLINGAVWQFRVVYKREYQEGIYIFYTDTVEGDNLTEFKVHDLDKIGVPLDNRITIYKTREDAENQTSAAEIKKLTEQLSAKDHTISVLKAEIATLKTDLDSSKQQNKLIQEKHKVANAHVEKLTDQISGMKEADREAKKWEHEDRVADKRSSMETFKAVAVISGAVATVVGLILKYR